MHSIMLHTFSDQNDDFGRFFVVCSVYVLAVCDVKIFHEFNSAPLIRNATYVEHYLLHFPTKITIFVYIF